MLWNHGTHQDMKACATWRNLGVAVHSSMISCAKIRLRTFGLARIVEINTNKAIIGARAKLIPPNPSGTFRTASNSPKCLGLSNWHAGQFVDRHFIRLPPGFLLALLDEAPAPQRANSAGYFVPGYFNLRNSRHWSRLIKEPLDAWSVLAV